MGVRGFKMFSQRVGGGAEFCLLDLCVGVREGVRSSTSPSVKKINRLPSY